MTGLPALPAGFRPSGNPPTVYIVDPYAFTTASGYERIAPSPDTTSARNIWLNFIAQPSELNYRPIFSCKWDNAAWSDCGNWEITGFPICLRSTPGSAIVCPSFDPNAVHFTFNPQFDYATGLSSGQHTVELTGRWTTS